MDPAKRDAVFSQVQGYAKEFDRLLLELNRKLAGETEREPASTLDRLTKNATSMRVRIAITDIKLQLVSVIT